MVKVVNLINTRLISYLRYPSEEILPRIKPTILFNRIKKIANKYKIKLRLSSKKDLLLVV